MGAAVEVPAPAQQVGTATRPASVADVVEAVAVVLAVAQANVHSQVVVMHLAVLWMSLRARACATRCLSARLRMLALQTIDGR